MLIYKMWLLNCGQNTVETVPFKITQGTINIVRRLKRLKLESKILCLFYNSVISSVLVYSIPWWYDACDKKNNN